MIWFKGTYRFQHFFNPLRTAISNSDARGRNVYTTWYVYLEYCPRSETGNIFAAELSVVAKLHAFEVNKQNVIFSTRNDVRTPGMLQYLMKPVEKGMVLETKLLLKT